MFQKVFRILFKTQSDSKGINDTKRQIDQASQSTGRFGGILGKLKTLSPFAMIAAGIGAVTLALRSATKMLNEYGQKQESVAKMDQILALQGKLTDELRVKLQSLAGEYQHLTAKADTEWMDSLSRLVQFGADTSNIEQYAEAVKNLAGVLENGDIATATMLITRAMQGQFDMFTRYGIVIERTGDQLTDMNNLMTKVAEMGGGVLEAKANTINQQWKLLKLTFGDFNAALGQHISRSGVAQTAMSGLTSAFKTLASAIGGPIDRIKGIKNKLGESAAAARDASEEFDNLDSPGLKDARQQAADLAANLGKAASEAEAARKKLDALAQAELRQKLADIDLKEEKGEITKAEATRMRIEAERAHEQESFARQQEQFDSQVEDAQKKQLTSNLDLSRAKDSLRSAQRKYNTELQAATRKGYVGKDQAPSFDPSAAMARLREGPQPAAGSLEETKQNLYAAQLQRLVAVQEKVRAAKDNLLKAEGVHAEATKTVNAQIEAVEKERQLAGITHKTELLQIDKKEVAERNRIEKERVSQSEDLAKAERETRRKELETALQGAGSLQQKQAIIRQLAGIDKAGIMSQGGPTAERQSALVDVQADTQIKQLMQQEAERVASERYRKEQGEAALAETLYTEAKGMPQTGRQRKRTAALQESMVRESAEAAAAEANLRGVQSGDTDVVNRLLGISEQMLNQFAQHKSRLDNLESRITEQMN